MKKGEHFLKKIGKGKKSRSRDDGGGGVTDRVEITEKNEWQNL